MQNINVNRYSDDELAIILVDSFSELEYKHKISILATYDKPSDIFSNLDPAIKYINRNLGEAAANTFYHAVSGSYYTGFVIDLLNKKDIVAITHLNKDYPKELLALPLMPLVLYCKGNINLLKAQTKISVVGSRKTLPFVLKKCENICAELAKSGAVIVTGSALGGDRSAILGSIESGNVISVLAHGQDYIYPQSNRELIEKVAEKGLVVSEYPPDVQSAPWRFPMRNRVIAALGCSCFIVSGNMESGTRYTAKFAEAYSRRIYAFPYSIGEKSGEICNLLIKLNKASLVEEAEDIALVENIKLSNEVSVELSDDEKIILDALDGESSVDELCDVTGKKAHELLPVLSMLEIKGLVSRGKSSGSYVSIKKSNNRFDD